MGKGLLESLIAEGEVGYIWAWILKLGGVGVIGMQLNFMAIPGYGRLLTIFVYYSYS